MTGDKEKIGVIGSGVMGSGIAQVMAIAGHLVVAYDLDPDVVAVAPELVAGGRFGIQGAVARGKMTESEAQAALARIEFTTDQEAAAEVDVILEAVPERLDLKIQLFRDLDQKCPEHTIFASNSSGYPVQALAVATDRADRVIGWHWASPPPVMKLAEIVRAPQTSDETTETICRLAAAAGKNPVVIQDSAMHWGYVTNRVYGAMIREANAVVAEGIASRAEVDQLMVDCFRWPSGPYGMVSGATTGWKADKK
ncbi:3-hydroxyacyl-CoA dehydrogenase family protein [Candidatus Poriferisocius sp.]|uniref:3-hydroxyacyl-CoA dehydrogenase family protein n=1 Tax=Candidatus Poriferisocius sp. TaxID=3101276 RepID=UPI003B520A49